MRNIVVLWEYFSYCILWFQGDVVVGNIFSFLVLFLIILIFTGWQANLPRTMLGRQQCRSEDSLSTRNLVAAPLRRELVLVNFWCLSMFFVECNTSSLFLYALIWRFIVMICFSCQLFVTLLKFPFFSNVLGFKKTFVQIRNIGE